MASRRTLGLALLAWYFLAVSQLPYGGAGVTTNGPFPSKDLCEAARIFVRTNVNSPKYPVNTFACWETTK